MKVLLGLVLILVSCAGHSAVKVAEPILLANQVVLHSKILNEERNIVVSLPAGYQESDINYPVLYLLDGVQNIQHVAGSAEILTRTGSMPPMIIVGIKSVNRVRDYTPTNVASQSLDSGGADNFLDFISNELFPYIDKKYRTHPFRILEGHSLGGLFAGHVLLKNSELFDAYIIMNPAFWWDGEEIIKRANKFIDKTDRLDKSVYFAVGKNDGIGMIQVLRRFVEIVKKGKLKGVHLWHEEIEGEGHMSTPLLANYYGLKHIFSEIQYSKARWKNFTDTDFLAHENRLSEKYGDTVKQSEETYASLGRFLLAKKNYSGAITVFKQMTEKYDSWYRNFADLANAYEMNGNPKRAVEAFQKAHDLAIKLKSLDQANKYLKRISLIKKPVIISNSVFSSYSGRYKSKNYDVIFSVENKKLIGKYSDGYVEELYPESSNIFYLRNDDPSTYEFVKGEKGKVTKMIVHTLTEPIIFEKLK